LACTLYLLGDFESARQYAMRGVQIWRSRNIQTHPEDYVTPVVDCLIFGAMSDWHFGEIATCHAMMDEAVSIAKEQKDRNALAHALMWQ
jgi:anaphase-promoting complex subunit 5